MKIRVMGTRDECSAFADLAKRTIDDSYLRSISAFYPNRRGACSNEGRIYIEVDLPAGARAIPRRTELRDPTETLLEHWGEER